MENEEKVKNEGRYSMHQGTIVCGQNGCKEYPEPTLTQDNK